MTFTEVTTAGTSTVDAITGGAPLPPELPAGRRDRYYDIDTTAEFSRRSPSA